MKNLINEIENQVIARIKELDENLNRESNQLLADAKKEGESIYKKIVKQGKEKIEERVMHDIENARTEVNGEVLKYEKELIDDVFDLITLELRQFALGKRKVAKLNYRRFLRKCLKRVGKEIRGKKVIYCSGKDERLLKKMVRGSKVIKSNVLGGIIVEDLKKTKRIDLTFDKLIDFRRKMILEKARMVLEK